LQTQCEQAKGKTPMSDAKIQAILAELRDTNKEKRRTAVMKLGMLGGKDAVRALIRTLENDYEDLIVRGRAAMLLGKLGDTRAVDPLIRALDAPGYQTPLAAVESLGQLGDIRAISALRFIAETGRDRLQDSAITALSKLGYEFDPETEDIVLIDIQPEPEL